MRTLCVAAFAALLVAVGAILLGSSPVATATTGVVARADCKPAEQQYGRCGTHDQSPSAASACRGAGYLDLYDQHGNPFRNVGTCVSHAARGSELVLLKLTLAPAPDITDTGAGIPGPNWAIYTQLYGLRHADSNEMETAKLQTYWLWALPGKVDVGGGSSSTGAVSVTTALMAPCSAGYTGVYVTAVTHSGYPVTSRVFPISCS